MSKVQKTKRRFHKVAMERTADLWGTISASSSLEAKALIAECILAEVVDYERAIAELEPPKKKLPYA
jgi:hypothetical protein